MKNEKARRIAGAVMLGAALLFALTFLILFYSATGRKLLTLAGVGVLGAGAAAAGVLYLIRRKTKGHNTEQ